MDEKTVAIEITKDFKFAHRGCDVTEYKAGTKADVSERCAEVALAEKWAKPVAVKATKANKSAPENKDAAVDSAAPQNKDAAVDSAAPENKDAAVDSVDPETKPE